LEANDRAVSLPIQLTSDVLGVTGLDNAAPVLTLDQPSDRPGRDNAFNPSSAIDSQKTARGFQCSDYYGQVVTPKQSGLPSHWGVTSFPTVLCGYNAVQIRAAYGANTTNTGRGQTVALIEQGLTPDMFETLADYAAANRMPTPSSSRYTELSLGGKPSCGDPFDGEEQLDVEAAYDMAPAASLLVVSGNPCTTANDGLSALFDADLAVIDGNGTTPLATIVSNSWENPAGESYPVSSYQKIVHSYLIQAAAEGVGMYFSAGDQSGVAAPSSDPYAIAVGGTTLGIDQSDQRLFETGWSTGLSEINLRTGDTWQFLGEQSAGGGGPSAVWAEPSWQKGVVPAALTKPLPGNTVNPARSVPDISADADPFTGFALGYLDLSTSPPTYLEEGIGGTSLASPLVAGMVAAAQQGQATPFGFLDPTLYQLAGTAAFNSTLPVNAKTPAAFRGVVCYQSICQSPTTSLTTFDDEDPNMAGYTGQVTLKGYDNMTGLGTPAGQSFIAELRGGNG
jgi:subtilase family serine protease